MLRLRSQEPVHQCGLTDATSAFDDHHSRVPRPGLGPAPFVRRPSQQHGRRTHRRWWSSSHHCLTRCAQRHQLRRLNVVPHRPPFRRPALRTCWPVIFGNRPLGREYRNWMSIGAPNIYSLTCTFRSASCVVQSGHETDVPTGWPGSGCAQPSPADCVVGNDSGAQ